MRELARRIGLSHVTLLSFLEGSEPRRSTTAAIQRWLDAPDHEEVFDRWRKDLTRLLGQLPARDRKLVEAEFLGSLEAAFKRTKLEVPAWLRRLR